MASPRPLLVSFGFPCDVAGTGASGRARCQPRLQLLLGNHPEDEQEESWGPAGPQPGLYLLWSADKAFVQTILADGLSSHKVTSEWTLGKLRQEDHLSP